MFQVIWLKMCNYCETKRSLVLIYVIFHIYRQRGIYIFIICLYLPSVTALFSVAFHTKSQFTIIHFNFLNFISYWTFTPALHWRHLGYIPTDLPVMKNNSPVSPHLMFSFWSIQKTEPLFLQTKFTWILWYYWLLVSILLCLCVLLSFIFLGSTLFINF